MKKVILIILSLGLSLSASANSSESIRGALTEILNKIDTNKSVYKTEKEEVDTYINEEFRDSDDRYYAMDYSCLGRPDSRVYTNEREVYDCMIKDSEEKYLENKSNYTKIAISLIKLCPDLNSLDKNGQTFLTRAISSSSKYGDEYEEIAEALLNNKEVDINVQNKYGNTALMLAIIRRDTKITKALINKGAKLNVKNKLGQTALILASMRGQTSVAKALINKGADVNLKDNNGKTALILASMRGQTSIAKALINKGADVNLKDNNGKTALEIAAKEGNINIMNLLIGATADSCSNKNKTDKNSLKSCPGV